MVYRRIDPLIMNAYTVFLRKIGSLFNQYAPRKELSPHMKGYDFVKDLTPVYSPVKNRVVLYRNKAGELVVGKRVSFNLLDLDSEYLRNEANVLKYLTSLSGVSIQPEFVEYKETAHSAYLVTKSVNGQKIEDLDRHKRSELVLTTLDQLTALSERIHSKQTAIPKRNILNYYLSMKILCAKLILKNPAQALWYVHILLRFLFTYSLGSLRSMTYGLSHRDLFPDNILYDADANKISVLDWEGAVVTDALYDLSQISVIYTHEIGTETLVSYLKKNLITNSERRRYIGLAILNAVQILSSTPMDHHVFHDVSKNIRTIVDVIQPAIMQKKSPFEIVNSLTLDCIWYFYKITGRKIFDQHTKIILCYHSVGDDGWRFSTNPKLFERHLQAIKSQTKISSLTNLLESKSGGVNISFDDGYANLLDNALPRLSSIGATATLFALSDGEHARRDELENYLPIMSIPMAQTLHRAGWEIGYHTATHPNLEKLTSVELDQELIEGKKKFEGQLGFKLDYFAYPRGISTDEARAAVRKAGFKMAFTVDGAPALPGSSDPMMIDRVPVEGEITAEQLMALISPIGLKVSHVFLKTLQLKERYLSYH